MAGGYDVNRLQSPTWTSITASASLFGPRRVATGRRTSAEHWRRTACVDALRRARSRREPALEQGMANIAATTDWRE